MIHNIVIAPNINPDGYEYSRAHSRMWRKNRRPVGCDCVGVDLNRNYGDHWAVAGVKADACSNMYPGSVAFSEPETKAVRTFIAELLDSYAHDLVFCTWRVDGVLS